MPSLKGHWCTARAAARSLTCAALDGPHRGGGAWRGGRPQGHALVILGAALLDGPHVAVAPHAEAAGHGQVQRLHRLRLQLAEHRLTHGLELPVHLHLAHLRTHRVANTWRLPPGGGPTSPLEVSSIPRRKGTRHMKLKCMLFITFKLQMKSEWGWAALRQSSR